jgi:hypothetical protein
MFREPYAALIQSFYEGTITLSDLNDDLVDALIANEVASRPYRMMQPDYVNAVLANPQHPVNLALADNDAITTGCRRHPCVYYIVWLTIRCRL